MVFLWMWFSVIMCGNIFVLKLLEKDFLSVLFIVEFVVEVGFFFGVFNVVNGDKVVVDYLFEDSII